ncbi:RDD family protein [Candidatus Nanopelagicales bacterium]|nr:RDD family protein [Candidatus Nanopelagicales bacterium]
MAAVDALIALLLISAVSESDGPKRSFNPFGRITNAAAGVIDVNALLADVDVDELVERIDINTLAERVDFDAILARIDPDILLDKVDADALLDRVDPNRLLDRVNPDQLLDRVDPNALLDRVDPDRLLDRVDPDRLLDRVDANALLERVDPNDLVARVDLNAALEKVDFDAILARVDVAKVVERAGVPELVSQSTGHLFTNFLDLARRQLVAVDQIVMRLTLRLFGRNPEKIPLGPPALAGPGTGSGKGVVTGHYAGPLSRLLGFLTDLGVVFGTFTIITAGILFLLTTFLDQTDISLSAQTALGLGILVVWTFTYAVVSLVIAGRTLGKWLVGDRVVATDGHPIKPWQAVVRVLVMPLSFLLFGLGFLGLLFGAKRRALHDLIAGTVVVYDWGDRQAEMSAPLSAWLSRRDDNDFTLQAGPPA